MDEEESRVLFSSFMEHIRQKLDNEPEVIRVIIRRFNKASASFVHSQEFKHLMEKTISNIDSSPGQKYVYIKEFTDELKAYDQAGKNAKKREASPDGGDLCNLAKKAKIDNEKSPEREKIPEIKTVEKITKSTTSSSNGKNSSLKETKVTKVAKVTKVLKVELNKRKVEPIKTKEPKPCSTKSAQDTENHDVGEVILEKAKDEEAEKALRGSKKQIMKLEKLLKEIHEEIVKIQDQDMGLEDLDDETSLYILEDRYKKKMIRVWNKLCELKGRDSGTGRVIEKRFVYEGTPYPEINRKISAFINKKKVFPDCQDVQDIIHACNERYRMKLSRKILQSLGKQVFVEVGNKLQERRQMDFINNFGCPATDNFREYDDPALFDRDLSRKLEENKSVGKSNLEEIINKYAHKQDVGEEGDDSEEDSDDEEDQDSKRLDSQVDEEVSMEVEMEVKKADKEEEKDLEVEPQLIEESESSEEEVEDLDDSSIDEPILKDDYVVDGLQCTLNETLLNVDDVETGDAEERKQVLEFSSEEEEVLPTSKPQARQDCSRLVPVEMPKELSTDIAKAETSADDVSIVSVDSPVTTVSDASITITDTDVPPKQKPHTTPIKKVEEEVVTLSDDDDDVTPPVRLKPQEKVKPVLLIASSQMKYASNAVQTPSVSNPVLPNPRVPMAVPVRAPPNAILPTFPIRTPTFPIRSPTFPVRSPVVLAPGKSSIRVVLSPKKPPVVLPPAKSPVLSSPTKSPNVSTSPQSSVNSQCPKVVMKRCSPSPSVTTASPNSSKVVIVDDVTPSSVVNTPCENKNNISQSSKGTVQTTNDYLRKIAGVLTTTPQVILDDDDDDVITIEDPADSKGDNGKQNTSTKLLSSSVRSKLNFEPQKDYIKNLASKAVERVVKTLRSDSPVLNLCDTSSEDCTKNGASDDIVILD